MPVLAFIHTFVRTHVQKQYTIFRSFLTIFDVNIEDDSALAVKNIEVNFIFFARFLLSLRKDRVY